MRFKWTPLNGGAPQSITASAACGGPNNDVHVQSTVPLAYGPGTVLRLEITTTVNGVESPVSNSFTLTVEANPPVLGGSVNSGSDAAFGPQNTMAGWATTRITGNYNVGGLSLVAAYASPLEYPMGSTGEYQYAAAGFAGIDAPFFMACPAGSVVTGLAGTHSAASAISCPAGTKMMGLQGQLGGRVSGLGVVCR